MLKKIYLIVTVILLLLIVFCVFKIKKHDNIQRQANNINDLSELSDNNLDLDYYRKFYNNEDIIAMLKIADVTTLIVQSEDNDYYLNHLLDNSYNILGTPFLDYRNNLDDKKIIIYGHNAHHYETPLKVLEKYLNEDFYRNNSEIILTTDNKVITYKIFSVAEYENDYNYSILNVSDWEKHYDYLYKNSIYETAVTINSKDDILLLQTCSNTKKNSYIVLSGKKIKE